MHDDFEWHAALLLAQSHAAQCRAAAATLFQPCPSFTWAQWGCPGQCHATPGSKQRSAAPWLLPLPAPLPYGSGATPLPEQSRRERGSSCHTALLRARQPSPCHRVAWGHLPLLLVLPAGGMSAGGGYSDEGLASASPTPGWHPGAWASWYATAPAILGHWTPCKPLSRPLGPWHTGEGWGKIWYAPSQRLLAPALPYFPSLLLKIPLTVLFLHALRNT